MTFTDRIAGIVATRSKTVLVVFLVLTAIVGAGMPMVDDDSSLGQFEGDSPETQAATYIDENFAVADGENETAIQLILRDEQALSRESILDSLRFQQEIRNTPAINRTLVEKDPITGVENVLAISQIRGEQLAELEAATDPLAAALNETRQLQQSYAELNASYRAGELSDEEYQQQAGEIETRFEEIHTNATAPLTDEQAAVFTDAMGQVRTTQSELIELERAYQAGEIEDEETYRSERERYEEQMEAAMTQGTRGVYADEFEALESGDPPSLDEQIQAIQSLSESEYESLVRETLSEENEAALGLLPTEYDPGTTDAETRMTVLTQSTAGSQVGEMGTAQGPIVDGQLALQDLATDRDAEYYVFGLGIMSDETERSMNDSLAIVGPLALLFVIVALLIAYRDVLDIVLGVLGIGMVLVWTFGFMGWAGIAFNQMFVAVPVLLIGLSIDYAIHVFMRYREQRSAVESESEGGESPLDVRGGMKTALAGVGVALVWVTATAAIGFLSNLISPIQPIREFGIVSAVGITAALLVFGAFVPAMKVVIDSALESRGVDRRKRAFGTGGGRFSRILASGAVAARKAPVVVLIAALLLTAGGVYGAANVDTSFDEEGFLAESPPEWTERLPGSLSPGEYHMKESLDFVNEHYTREDSQGELLVRGDVTDPETLEAMANAEDQLGERTDDVVYETPTGEAAVTSPLGLMQQLADEDSDRHNESFAATFDAADVDGDGIPEENVAAVYDELLVVQPAAAQYVYRTDDGEYEAVRMVVSLQGDADLDEVTDVLRTVAGDYESAGDGAWEVTATGDPVVFHVVEQDLFETVLESLLITLVVVFAFLTLTYRLMGTSASLGAITLLPVAFATSWILGTMYLIGMPFNVLTGMITSLTIGLGVAYCIHVSSRYRLELERQGNVWNAMHTTVTGTGGALLGSAATTVGGFGTLSLAILPVLRQFGIITGLTIIYAFLASVAVLPAMLVLWTRYLGPSDVSFAHLESRDSEKRGATASDPDHVRGETE